MTAYEYIKRLPYLPYDKSQNTVRPSNSAIRRWLENKSIVINDKTPEPNEEIEYPITQLVFFPKGNKVTYL